MVSWSQLLCHMVLWLWQVSLCCWCRGCSGCHHTVWCHDRGGCCCCTVWCCGHSCCAVWCCGHGGCRCTAYGVAVMAIAPCVVVAVGVVVPCHITAAVVAWSQWVSSHYMVLQLQLLRCMVSWSPLLHHMWCCGHGHHTVWCCGHGGYHHAAWHHGQWLGRGRPWRERMAAHLLAKGMARLCGDWAAKDEVSRKKKKRKSHQQS